jgi:hypothetical protein
MPYSADQASHAIFKVDKKSLSYKKSVLEMALLGQAKSDRRMLWCQLAGQE